HVAKDRTARSYSTREANHRLSVRVHFSEPRSFPDHDLCRRRRPVPRRRLFVCGNIYTRHRVFFIRPGAEDPASVWCQPRRGRRGLGGCVTALQLPGGAVGGGAIVTLTDLPLTLPQLRANVSANMPSSGWPATLPTVLPLSWGQDHINFPSDWDLVLCADIVYLPETYSLLVKTLVHLCKNTTVVYLSSKMRKEHETPRFFEECLPSRFNVELVHRDDGQNINIYRASLRKDQ
uniref:EEF1A lysine methyltransferase 3 n=1 Tax=Gasterosteus aculeatus aculeatus TaxID=481459 RepID=A0AAQ4QZ99_GASAC